MTTSTPLWKADRNLISVSPVGTVPPASYATQRPTTTSPEDAIPSIVMYSPEESLPNEPEREAAMSFPRDTESSARAMAFSSACGFMTTSALARSLPLISGGPPA